MKKTGICFLLLCCIAFTAVSQNAKSIMRNARTKTVVNSLGIRAKIEIQKSGKVMNELLIDQYTVRNDKDARCSLIEFKAPASIKGTRFLMINHKNGTLDQRIYLPALGRVRRIAGKAEGSESFMGTDFSYNDVAYMDRDINLDTYRLECEELHNGVSCYVIEAVPKNADYEYSRTRVWIEKESLHVVRTECYDKHNKLVKIIEISNYKTLQGNDTPMKTKVSTLATDSATIITIEKMKYNMKIPAKVFTLRYLEQGR